MTSEFTYPSLRCIWEYMESNRRIHITSRSPQLRSVDKSIPFHINCLQLDDNAIKINDIEYKAHWGSEIVNPGDFNYGERPQEKQLTPGDIQADGELSWYRDVAQLSIKRNEPSFWRQFPNAQPYAVAKRLANLFFEGRCKIVTKTLQTREREKILRLPVGFKVHTNVIRSLYSDFPYILPIVELGSELTVLETYVSKEETLDHPQLRNAKRLVFDGTKVSLFMDKVVTLTNKYVIIADATLSENDIIRLVRYWIDNEKPIGTFWEIAWEEGKYGSLQTKLKEEFGGNLVQFEDSVDKCILPDGHLAIPIDSESNLVIGGLIREMPTFEISLIRIQSMPIHLMPIKPNKVIQINSCIVSIMNYVRKVLEIWNWVKI
uniref:FBA_2 domain-containing protein n=1 Tax=Caenorhabditis tropicalis TaxID=1561998 RepID=A0A1I7UDQ7_9PELO